MADKEKIAKSAANTWCRCFKCDGVINSTHEKCEKDKLLTCHKWYDGYRTAMLALSEYEQQLIVNAVDGHVGQTINGMLRALSDETYGDMGFTAGDKVKLIIIKED